MEESTRSPLPTEILPAVQAMSNLRCPSPPPILSSSRIQTPVPRTALTDRVRETVPAGGAILQELNKARSPDTAETRSPVLDAAPSPEINYAISPPAQSVHHKAPSVHAHFYVDETQKAGKSVSRLRSGLTSASGSEYLAATLRRRDERLALPGVTEQNANIDPRLPQDDGRLHVLFGVCGALLTLKIKLIINKLYEIYTADKIAIQLVLTKALENFISNEALQHLEMLKKVRVWRDADEWTTWNLRTDPVLHVELRRWADILVVCPLTANTLAKISIGLCDNLLTNVIRAWNTSYPILLAPAMVSNAYNAFSTKRQLRLIAEEMPWIEVLKPVEKVVGSYGDIGMGGMMDWNEIVNKVVMKLGGYPDEEEDDDDDSKNNEEDHAIADDENNDDDDEDEDDDDDDEDDDDDDDEDDDDDDDEADEVARVKKEVLERQTSPR